MVDGDTNRHLWVNKPNLGQKKFCTASIGGYQCNSQVWKKYIPPPQMLAPVWESLIFVSETVRARVRSHQGYKSVSDNKRTDGPFSYYHYR